MWEWSGSKKKSASVENTSLLKAYASYLPKTSTNHKETISEIPSLQYMESLLQNKISTYDLKNIKLKLIDFQPLSWEKKHLYSEKQVIERKRFLKFIGYSHTQECLDAGLDKNDIDLLKQSISPENYVVHIRIPFDFGGKVSIDNMCLVQTHPLHDQLHALIEYQLEKNFLKHHKKLYIPIIEGIIKNA